MNSIGKLSETQHKELLFFESEFNSACFRRDLQQAKYWIARIHNLLKPLKQYPRLSQNKCQYCELLINERCESVAIPILQGIIKLLNCSTRGRLEASTLLAICYLRNNQLDLAEPLMQEVLSNDSVIKSDFQRRNFQRTVMNRFNEESILATLRSLPQDTSLDPVEIQHQAGICVCQHANEDDIYEIIGEQTPAEVRNMILKIELFSQKQLPHKDLLCLPSPERFKQNREVGKAVGGAMKKAMHRGICDPENETHKLFINNGISGVINNVALGTTIVSCFYSLKIAISALAIPATAFLIKYGIDVFCEMYPLDEIMTQRKTRKRKKNRLRSKD